MEQHYHIRVMTGEDLPQCQTLRQQIRWNQTIVDWQRFLSLNPVGCFVVTDQDRIVGTVCTVAYQSFGWIAMVIVDEAYRRKGIGRMLLLQGIEHLESRNLTVKLDATPEGKQLYDTLGFVDEYNAARYECFGIGFEPKPMDDVIQITQDTLEEVAQFDVAIFGEKRKHVQQSYMDHYSENALYLKVNQQVQGYIMGREGDRAFHIGPWVARNETAAQYLFTALLNQRKPENVFVDIVEPNKQVLPILEPYTFEMQRKFIRMYKGKNHCPGMPHLIYGMSGAELG